MTINRTAHASVCALLLSGTLTCSLPTQQVEGVTGLYLQEQPSGTERLHDRGAYSPGPVLPRPAPGPVPPVRRPTTGWQRGAPRADAEPERWASVMNLKR